MIRRSPTPNRWTSVPNAALEDDTLSWKARGLLTYLLSKPDHWQTTIRGLVGQGPDGYDAVQTGLAELEQAGYLERHRERGDDGQFRWVSTLHDAPMTGKSTRGSSTRGKPGQVVTTEEVTTEQRAADAAEPVPAPRARPANPLWDALVDAFGPASTDTRRKFYGKTVAELKQVGATPEQVTQRVAEARRRWRRQFTPQALLKHWDDLANVTTGSTHTDDTGQPLDVLVGNFWEEG